MHRAAAAYTARAPEMEMFQYAKYGSGWYPVTPEGLVAPPSGRITV